MKITSIRTYFVTPRCLLVRVDTDEGITGAGEALPDKGAATVGAIRHLAAFLAGKDPRQIELHWQEMYRGGFWRGGPILNAAISGIEQAFWDITGKSLGVPVSALLGGACRTKVKAYRGIGGGTLDDLANSAKEAVKAGFKAVKFGPLPTTRWIVTASVARAAGEQMEAVRQAVGDEVDILIDCHGRLGPAGAIQVGLAVAPFRPLFIEEPCLPENVDALAQVARSVPVPIATGERLFTRFGFREVLEKQAAAVLQPDLGACGGIFEARKIAAMAETYYVCVAPHDPYGPVMTAATLQLDLCTPNFLVQELGGLGEGVLLEPLKVEEGYLLPPGKPGLGIEVDWEKVEKSHAEPFDPPVIYLEDGSVADW